MFWTLLPFKIEINQLNLLPVGAKNSEFCVQISEIELYELLKTNMGDLEAKNLVEYIESKVDKKFIDAKNIFATKEDTNNLKTEIEKLRSEFKIEIEKSRTETEKGFKEQLRWIIVLNLSTIFIIILLIKFL